MTFGINVDLRFPLGRSEPDLLYANKFRGIRFTNFESVNEIARAYQSYGLKCLAIATAECDYHIFDDTFTPDIVEVDNEPDVTATWQSPQQYANLWIKIRNENDHLNIPFFSAGLASGGMNAVNYMEQVIAAIADRAPLPDAIAIHPYGKNHVDGAGEFDIMWNAFQIPVVATEYWVDVQTMDMWDFVCMLHNTTDGRSTIWSSWYCLSDAMVAPFGLMDASGFPKDAYYSLLSCPCLPT